MQKNIFLTTIVFSLFSPLMGTAQVFDDKITLAYYYRSLNNIPAIRKANKYLTEINSADFPRVSVPASALLDLRLYGLDEKIANPFNAALERFNYIYASKDAAIDAIESIFEIQRIPTTYKLAAVISLAVITHNNGDYLKSIKYINWWHSYTRAKRHQLFYLLADNYLKIGDRKNAFKTYNQAVELWQNYNESGMDMRDEMGIENYDEMVLNLDNSLADLNEDQIQNVPSTIIIPKISDEFWIAKLVPKFPKAALRKGRTGYATIKFDISGKGNPINVTVVDASNSLFKKPTMTFIEDMKYIQYELPESDDNIATDATYRIDFKYIK